MGTMLRVHKSSMALFAFRYFECLTAPWVTNGQYVVRIYVHQCNNETSEFAKLFLILGKVEGWNFKNIKRHRSSERVNKHCCKVDSPTIHPPIFLQDNLVSYSWKKRKR